MANAVIHQSWWSRAASWVVHEAQTVKNIIAKVQTEMPLVDAEIKKIAPTAEAIAALIAPGSAGFMQHVVDVWSTAASVIDSADQAALANGVSVPLDAALVAKIKSFIPTVKSQMSGAASATAAPAQTPAPVQ